MLSNYNHSTEKLKILLEQYKLFVESAQKISDNRIASVNYYTAILSGLLVAITAFFEKLSIRNSLCVTGIVISLVASFTIIRYKKLNEVKFQIIHELEQQLPASIYKEEHLRIKSCKFPSFTNLELALFVIFAVAFFCILFVD